MNELNYPDYPIAEKKDVVSEIHGKVLVDPYSWMRLSDEEKEAGTKDPHTKKVLDYLIAENNYTNKVMAPYEKIENEIFEEIKGRFVPSDLSVPFYENGYFYEKHFPESKEYPVYFRRKHSLAADKELLIDVNDMAEGLPFYDLMSIKVSPNNQFMGFAEDSVSRRQYKLKFKNLITGEFIEDEIENTTGSLVWGSDNTVYYCRRDESLRPSKIYCHILGTDTGKDELIYHEKDEAYYASVYKSNSGRYIIISSWSTVSQEYRILDLEKADDTFSIFQKRERNLEHYIDHYSDKWFIHTNKDGAYNFKIMHTDLLNTTAEFWIDFIPHDPEVLIERIECFAQFMCISERLHGNTQIKIHQWEKHGSNHIIEFPESAYYAFTSSNYNYETEFIRIVYTSLVTPMSTYDFYIHSQELILKKQEEVLGGFDPKNYVTRKVFATARDGEEIPITMIYPEGFENLDNKPMLLYAYGSYGHSMDPYFSSARLSLLDRGMAFAIAHIRGGEEMGRKWYESGKLLYKKNTFYDFIDCGKYLFESKYLTDNQLFAMGGSAGGLLMGAIVNMEPELWKGIIAAVPFVDVINSMLDETIPLTTGEFDEWGNPKIRKYFDYMYSYSPYDNVQKQAYPAMFVTTGYHDSQVQYWEPAKWVAKLRESKTDHNILLLQTNLDTGHGGLSGRFRRFRETAREYVFLLAVAELIEGSS